MRVQVPLGAPKKLSPRSWERGIIFLCLPVVGLEPQPHGRSAEQATGRKPPKWLSWQGVPRSEHPIPVRVGATLRGKSHACQSKFPKKLLFEKIYPILPLLYFTCICPRIFLYNFTHTLVRLSGSIIASATITFTLAPCDTVSLGILHTGNKFGHNENLVKEPSIFARFFACLVEIVYTESVII